jgi:hypothetical protein
MATRAFRRLALLLVACLALSCASASQLARRSDRALRAGDPERAYTLALDAVGKEPAQPAAQAALAAASRALFDRRREAILARAAGGDTLEAANQVLQLDRLRARFTRDRVAVPSDGALVPVERRIREAGAAWYYDLALQSLDQDRPKEAYRRLLGARDLVPHFRDLDARIPRTWERALTRVALLPLNDEIGIPGLSRQLADEAWTGLSRAVTPDEFTFTRLVDQADVVARLPGSDVGRLGRDRAIAIGRAVGARVIVVGRMWNMRTETDTDRWHDALWRKVAEKDSSGRERTAWQEVPFEAVSRVRTVEVQVEFEVIDTDQEEALDERRASRSAVAHTVYTAERVAGDCDDYRLVSPGLAKSDAKRAEQIESHWKSRFGPWSVPQFLEHARRERGAVRYAREMRPRFSAAGAPPRVFLDDLPPPEDLAAFALEGSWRPVAEMLRNLDRQ